MSMSSLPAAILSHMTAVSNVPPPPLRSIPSEWGKPVGSATFCSGTYPREDKWGFSGLVGTLGALLTA